LCLSHRAQLTVSVKTWLTEPMEFLAVMVRL
jgi:hypothetical protein